nr:hypothetical protein [Celeribacter sp. HF31]
MPEPKDTFGATLRFADPDVTQRLGIDTRELRAGVGTAMPECEERQGSGEAKGPELRRRTRPANG